MRCLFGAHRPFNVELYYARLKEPKLAGAEWRHARNPYELDGFWRQFTPDWTFLLDWAWKVPTTMTDTGRVVGFHAADLPYNRGGSPIQHQILCGADATRLTAFVMNDELDAGPIALQRDLSLCGTLADIWRRIGEEVPSMIEGILEQVQRGTFSPAPQDKREATVSRRRAPSESALPLRRSLSDLLDHIRMVDCDGYPRAFLDVAGKRLTFRDARLNATGRVLRAEVEIAECES